MKRIFLLFLGAFALAIAQPAHAANDAPNVINYQGKLLNASGANVTDGTYTVQFKIYGAASGATFLWGGAYTVVVSAGYFNVMLGEGGTAIAGATYTSIADALGATITPYLGVTITADSSGPVSSPAEISPRLRFLSSPYALITAKAKYAEVATTATNALTFNGLEASRFLQPQNTTASTINGPLTMASTVTINQTLTVTGATAVSNLRVNGDLSVNATVGGGFVPVGGIIMWSGTTAPDGWALCNGSGTYTLNGVSTAIPDLQDRFMVGAGRSYAAKSTGGSSTSTLTASNIPDHRHSYKDTLFAENGIGAAGNSGPDGLGSGTDGGNNYPGSKSGWDGDNSLSWLKRYTDFARGNTSAVDSFSNVPPYYALAYIIRTR